MAAEACDLGELAREVGKRDARVIVDPPAEPVSVTADSQQVRRALANVVDNALKFSGEAPVRLSVGEESGWGVVRVADRGIGLTPHDAAQLFEKYARVDDPSVRRTPGVGLGLYLTRLLLRANGGSIDAASPGKGLGSTFVIRLPSPTRAVTTRAPSREGSSG